MKHIIHGGENEIGGNCIELFAESKRLILDFGIPLSADNIDDVPLPDIKGLLKPSDDLLGVIISHPHLDHYGLLNKIGNHVPVYIGKAAKRIIKAAEPYMPMTVPDSLVGRLENLETFSLGPFKITPYLMDHSAYDSYAVLVEAGGSRLFYTGDIRGHGRKGRLMDRFLRNPPKNIDTLIIEGTRRRSDGEKDSHGGISEVGVEEQLITEIKKTKGMVLVSCSGQNIDRLVSVFKACLKTKRTMLIDLYVAVILESVENASIPRPGWNNLKIFVPHWQRVRIKNSGDFSLIDRMKKYRVYHEDLAGIASKAVVAFRPSMARDFEKAECLNEAIAVWSMWPGYLENDHKVGKKFLKFCEHENLPLKVIHSSGHAPVELLDEIIKKIDAKETVFIHTFFKS